MLRCDITKKMDRMTLKVALQVKAGELLTVFGPSGAGKSSLLHIIAGITEPDCGMITLDEVVLFAKGQEKHRSCNMPIHKRHIGYIQQKCYLFPHMSIKENILYSVPKKAYKTIEAAYLELMEILDIEHLRSNHVNTLSGGEQQRVALARTLLMNPSLLLLDEPFSALDYQRRTELWKMVHKIKERYNIPMIFVTHDINEANELSNHIAVLKEGCLLQVDTPDNIHKTPESLEVAQIIRGNVRGK